MKRLRPGASRWLRALLIVAVCLAMPLAVTGIGLVPDGSQFWRPADLWTGGSPPVPGTFAAAVATGDFNGDGLLDLAIGDPAADVGVATQAGVVTILYGMAASGLASTGNQLWHQDVGNIPDTAESSDWFGYSLSAGDFNGDGFNDLAIGTPNEDFTASNAGSVQVLYGSASGLTDVGSQDWHQDVGNINNTNQDNDEFGTALATGDFDDDGYEDLAIGVPGQIGGGVGPSGMVSVIYGSAAGLSDLDDQVFRQGVAGILGTQDAGDRFGEVLAAGNLTGDGYADLVIGVPSEDITADADAGILHLIRGSSAGLDDNLNQTWDQADVMGLSSHVEAGDRFAATLAIGDFDADGNLDLAIGVPGENLDEGRVNSLYGNGGGLTTVDSDSFEQGLDGMLGIPSSGDLFGTALATGDFDGDGYADLGIGVSGETVSAITGAGALQVIYGAVTGLETAENQLFNQEAAQIDDLPEIDDAFGASLAAGDFDGDGTDDLAIGAPGEVEISAVGALNVLYGQLCGNGLIDTGEECDDGNIDDNDGCSAVCVVDIADADVDGMPDSFELTYGFDPNDDDEDSNGTIDGLDDFDSDGLDNASESAAGTDPTNADSDADNVSDGDEVNTHGTDPTVFDTDGDGLGDGLELSLSFTDPLDTDSDDDGFSDGGEHLALSDPNDGTSLPFFGLPEALNSDASIDSADNSWSDLATDGVGNWVATWEEFDGVSWDIAVSRSNDNGASWSPKEIFLDGQIFEEISGSAYRRPRVAIDPSGKCIVTYQSFESILGSNFYRVRAQDSTDLCATPDGSGAAWETEPGGDPLFEDFLPEQSPSIATDGSGNFVIVWAEPEFGIFDWDIWTARSLDGGMSWTAKANLSANTGLDASVEIATDASGTWIAAWTSNDDLGGSIGSDQDILFATSIDNGATWNTGAALNGNADADSGGDTDPHLTSDGVGNWIVVWESGEDLGGSIGTDTDILASTSIDGGANWSLTPTVVNSEAIVDGSSVDISPHISTDAAGNWYAIWHSNNPMALGPENQDFDLLVSRSTDNGTSWSAQALANLNGASDLVTARSPRLITDRNGHWVLGWEGPGEVTTGPDDDINFATAFGPDSDGDGLADGEEANSLGTDPLDADTDEDGLTDGDEVNVHLTDPLDLDSDDDGFSDGAEISAGSDPLDSGSTPAPAVPALPGSGIAILAALLGVTGMRYARSRPATRVPSPGFAGIDATVSIGKGSTTRPMEDHE